LQPVLAGSGSSWFVELESEASSDHLCGLELEVAGNRAGVRVLSAGQAETPGTG
jgi:hypothetical protein